MSNASRPDVAWIDGVGGLALVTAATVTIGREAEIRILANLPRVAGTMRRRGEDWFFGDKDGETLLVDDEWLPLPGDVRCRLCRPSHLTTSRRLDLDPPHRWAGGIDSVLLVSKIVTIGPTRSDVIRAPDLEQTHFLSPLEDPMTLRCKDEIAPVHRDRAVSCGDLTVMLRSWDV